MLITLETDNFCKDFSVALENTLKESCIYRSYRVSHADMILVGVLTVRKRVYFVYQKVQNAQSAYHDVSDAVNVFRL